MIDSFSRAVTMSVLTRALAIIFAFCVLMAALGLAIFELAAGQPINPLLSTVLGTGMGYALHAIGLNQGLILEPSSPPPVTHTP